MDQIDKEEEKQLNIPPMAKASAKGQAMSMRPRTVGGGTSLGFNPVSAMSKQQNIEKQNLKGNNLLFSFFLH